MHQTLALKHIDCSCVTSLQGITQHACQNDDKLNDTLQHVHTKVVL